MAKMERQFFFSYSRTLQPINTVRHGENAWEDRKKKLCDLQVILITGIKFLYKHVPTQ